MHPRRLLGPLFRQCVTLVNRRELEIRLQQPLVSFTFDDVAQSACHAGAAILGHYGAHATYYVARCFISYSAAGRLPDQCTEQDLDEVIADGHELGSHTFSHLSSRRASKRAYVSDALEGHDSLRRHCWPVSQNFSYPFGHVSPFVKGDLGKHFDTCRGIQPGINSGLVDLNCLRANALYSSTVQSSTVERLIERAAHSAGWIIFYTHELLPKPSAHGCTPDFFSAAIKSAIRGGARVLSVVEALAVIRANPSSAAR